MACLLEGIRVLDFSQYMSGPYCAALLADMGADVIKAERPGGNEDRRLGPLAPNGYAFRAQDMARNKRGITINLSMPKGKELLAGLVERSDIVVENSPPRAAKAAGLDYDSLKAINSRMILVGISAFGWTGPYSGKSAFDAVAQGMSGAMMRTGFPGNPPTRATAPYADLGTASLAALGAMFALYHREKTGEGQMVDVSLFDTAIVYMATYLAENKALGIDWPQMGNGTPVAAPYDCYKARDGWVFFAVLNDSIWRRLAKALGGEALAAEYRFKDNKARADHRREIDGIINAWISGKSVQEACEALERAGVPHGPVKTVPEVVKDPQLEARQLLLEVDMPGMAAKLPISGIPIKMSKTPGAIARRPPLVGEHNAEVYSELLGLSAQALEQLAREGVI